MKKYKKIFVTGGAGYIGSILIRMLLEDGYEVTLFDKFYFGKDSITSINADKNFKIVEGDIRDRRLLEETIPGHDAVIHLAAIVGDPACAADADLAVQVNFNATVTVAEIAKKSGIERFVFASTCSVYGANQDEVRETSELNPLSLYAQSRLYGERGIVALAEGKFQPTILRFGTVYGLSPRMRFDLVVNYLTLKIFRENKMSIFGGDQWRPLVHVADIARAVKLALEAPAEKVAGEVFNVGSNSENYQLKELLPVYQSIFPKAEVSLIEEMEDKRSYRVNFDKISSVLNFKTNYYPEKGIREIREYLENAGPQSDFDHMKFYNHKTISNVSKI